MDGATCGGAICLRLPERRFVVFGHFWPAFDVGTGVLYMDQPALNREE